MKLTNIIAAFGVIAVVSATSSVHAQQAPGVDQAFKEIEAAYGVVPTFVKAYPKTAVAEAWALTRALELNPESKLDAKVKSLINIAVAAQIPCRYCVWLDTKMAKAAGATDEEISEAVAQAGLTRHWSAVLNGMQIDFETLKAEFGGD